MARDEKTAEIQKTFNYDQFKFIYQNRDINKSRIVHLVESIKKKNLLCYEPILVNTKKEVVDGQHRLKAAEKLHVAIYYIIGENTVLEDIVLLNAYNRNWVSLDYLNFYIKTEHDSYKELKKVMDKYHISVSMAMACLTMKFYAMGDTMKNFKEGNFVITHQEEAIILLEEIESLKKDDYFTKDVAYQDREFMKAYVILRQHIQFADFVAKLKTHNLKIERQMRRQDYLRDLERLINFKNKTGKSIRIF